MAEVEANLATFASEIPPRNLQARSEIHCQHPRHGSSSKSLEILGAILEGHGEDPGGADAELPAQEGGIRQAEEGVRPTSTTSTTPMAPALPSQGVCHTHP